MSVVIRLYKAGDREVVVALWRAAGLVRRANDPYRDIDRKMAVDPEGLLLAVDGGEVVGTAMVGYDGHRGWLNYLGVHPDRRREGVGRALVEAALARLRAKGCPKLNLQFVRSNETVRGFYEALGFKEDPCVSMGFRLVDDETG